MLSALRTFILALVTALLLVFLYCTSLYSSTKQIALTFDDGPNPKVLPNLLSLLYTYHIHATFFVIGSVAKDNPIWLMRETAEKHEVENHSWGHENMKKSYKAKGESAIRTSLEKTSTVITEATDTPPHFFRPPYWETNPDITAIVEKSGYHIMRLEKPDINSLDYEDVDKHRSVDILIDRVKKLIETREKHGITMHVLVFHELPLTVEALKILIPYFQNEGYTFLRLDKFNN